MSTVERTRRDARREPHRRRRLLRVIAVTVAVLFVFLLGVAFARTLDERPQRSGDETTVRTLTPRPQDAPGRTVTVTVTATGP